mgnify:CR=1 FL=1
MIIDRDHILKLADLAKITLSEEEIDSYISDVNKILDLFSEIKDVDTKGVEPLANVLDEFSDTREDIPLASIDRDVALENAPDTDGVYFQVPETIRHNKEIKDEKD